MAKRKRLGGPNPDFATSAPESRTAAPIAGVAADAAATAALGEMAAALHDARVEGRMILSLPLDSIDLGYLVRDRLSVRDDAMEALIASIRARGQQVPIEVAELAAGRYGLISGWRRCHALRRLADEDPRFESVKAVLRRPEEASDAYIAMIEENEIRVGLSYYERARIVSKSTLNGVFESEKKALSVLFQSGSRARRSKIGTFLPIVHALDGALRFPEMMTERVGLRLGRALQERPSLGSVMVAALERAAPESAAAEAACLLAELPKKGSNKVKSVDVGVAATLHPCPGIDVTTHPDGRVTLSGAKVDGTLRSRLFDWLKSQG
jgi:ParB/RepB/Spo0J family partition protein